MTTDPIDPQVEKLLAEAEKEYEDMVKSAELEQIMFMFEKADAERKAHMRGEYTQADYEKEQAIFDAVMSQSEKTMSPEARQAALELLEFQYGKIDAEREAHKRGEYTQADYEKEKAIFNTVMNRQKGKTR